MIKLLMVGPSQYRERAVAALQVAGVVHIELREAGEASGLPELKRIDAALKILDRFAGREIRATGMPAGDQPDLVGQVEDLSRRLGDIAARLAHLQGVARELEPWGDFDPGAVRELGGYGVYIGRFRSEGRDLARVSLPEDSFLQEVPGGKHPLFFVISREREPLLAGASSLPWPEAGLASVRAECRTLEAEQAEIESLLAGLAASRGQVRDAYLSALNRESLRLTVSGLFAQDYLFGLEGWVPAQKVGLLEDNLCQAGLPLKLELREPASGEQPPLLLKNNRFIRRIEPLLKLYGLPRYRDLDPSYFFAPFMVLFFGICLSDAGYGLVFLLAAHLMEKKLGPKNPALVLPLKLCQAFAVSTILVGIITGSVFGYEFASRQWILLDVSVGAGDPMLFFYLALGLGVLHLSFSYLLGMLQASSYQGVLQKLATLLVLWGGVILVSRNIWFAGASCGQILHYAGSGVIVAGLLLTLLFSSEHKNWLARLGLGLWSIYGLTGLIGDLLSYARLFGLGIATSAIASVMNQLAGMAYGGAGPVLGIPLAGLILAAGHSFNLALSILGSTVHSARLHFVEAFKNFFQGGGIEYKPFKIERG
jgi:V/A-type H+-transporting ATPase subunit I